MEVYFEGYSFNNIHVHEQDTSCHVSYMENIDIISHLCETAKQSFSLLTTTKFRKISLKHHPNMSAGEKELCLNIIFQIWKSSIDEDVFYQSLVLRICLSSKLATIMNELLYDMTSLNTVS